MSAGVSVSRRGYGKWAWVAWLMLLVVAGVGLRGYRIDNNIARWTPQLSGTHGGAFVLVGYERGDPDAGGWFAALSGSPGVGLVLPVRGDGSMDGWLVLTGTGDADADVELLDSVRGVLGSANERVALAGPAVFREAIDRWSQRGLPLASGLILVIGAAVMWVTTRRWRRVAESLFAVFSAQIILTGLIALTGTAMDMVLSMTPPLLMGLGFSFAAHRATRAGVVKPLGLSMATTAVALGMFGLTDFHPVRAFGLWGAAGVVLTWVGVMLLVKPSGEDASGSLFAGDKSPKAGRGLMGWAVVVPAAVVTVVGFLALPRLQVEYDTLAYFPPDARVVRDYHQIEAELTGTLPFELTVSDAGVDPTGIVRRTPGVRRFERVLAGGGDGPAVYMGLADTGAMRALAEVQDDWRAWAEAHGTQMRWLGVAAQIDHIGRSVWRTACWALPAMLVVAMVSAWLIDRRASAWLLCLWVNAFPIAVLACWLAFSGRPVGLPSLLISALSIGVSVDDTLHILWARRETGSFAGAVRKCRRACLGSSIATALCMMTLMMCPFRPTAEFGGLLALSIIAAAVGDLLVLPYAAGLLRADHGAGVDGVV